MVNQAILRKDHPVADALFGVDNTFLTRALDAGIFDPYTREGSRQFPPACTARPAAPRHADRPRRRVRRTTTSRGSATTVIPPAPTSLDVSTEPQYKNLTVVENAATSSPGLAFLLATIAHVRRRRLAGLLEAAEGERRARRRRLDRGLRHRLHRGRRQWRPPDRRVVRVEPAADVEFSSPHRDTPHVGVVDSTCFRQIEFAGVLHGAKNPPGAQALIDFMLSRRFQEDMPLQMYVHPVIPDAALPAVFTKWAVDPADPPYTIDPATIGAQPRRVDQGVDRASWCDDARACAASLRARRSRSAFVAIFFAWPLGAILGRSFEPGALARRARRRGAAPHRVVHVLAGGGVDAA